MSPPGALVLLALLLYDCRLAASMAPRRPVLDWSLHWAVPSRQALRMRETRRRDLSQMGAPFLVPLSLFPFLRTARQGSSARVFV